MKQERIVTNCEYCDKQWEMGNQHISKDKYESGFIIIRGDSALYLPRRVVDVNHKDGRLSSHTKDLDGIYCNYKCLMNRCKELLNEMPQLH